MPQTKSFIPSFKKNSPFLFGCIIFLVIAGALIYLHTSFKIKNVVVLGSSKNNPLINGLQIIENQNLVLLSENKTKDHIVKANPYIKDLSITKKYPDTVQLKVSYRSPTAYLEVKEGFFLVSEDGIILEKSREQRITSLPLMKYYQYLPFTNYQAGQELISKDIQDSLYFLEVCKELKIPINSIDIKGFNMLGLYTSNESYFFSSEKERAIQEYQLKQAVQQLKISGKKYKSIDLRFDKPVVTF